MNIAGIPEQQNALPEGIHVAKKVEQSVFYRPWTYLVPYVDRFIAVDKLSVRKKR